MFKPVLRVSRAPPTEDLIHKEKTEVEGRAHFGIFDVENYGDLRAPGSVRCSDRDQVGARVCFVVDWPAAMLFESKTNYSSDRRGGP